MLKKTTCVHAQCFLRRSVGDSFPFSLKHYAYGLDRKTRFKTSVSNARIPVQISECQGYLGPEVDTDLFLVEKITLNSGVLFQAELTLRYP